MKQRLFVLALIIHAFSLPVKAQNDDQPALEKPEIFSRPANGFTVVKVNPATNIKDQARTGTCWSFSTTSLLESQLLKNKLGSFDLSEMFTVRNMYVEKARNYILRQGSARFDEGGLGHDVIRSIDRYGAVPENVYTGMKPGETVYDHGVMVKMLKRYLDSMLKTQARPIPANWMTGYNKILDEYMGVVPEYFKYNGKRYSPKTFAQEAMNFKADDYVNITSFTHQPYYKPCILDVPDNFSNGSYYNLPLNEMIDLVKTAVNNGYTVMWDADVSNNGFFSKAGFALNLPPSAVVSMDSVRPDMPEDRYDEKMRQQLYETLVTQDDHLMHITGMQKSKSGKLFFIVKNSYGASGAYKGYINVSEAYFAINTISLVLPKAAINKALLDKLKIQ